MASKLTRGNTFSSVYAATAAALKDQGGSRSEPWLLLLKRMETLCDATFQQAHAGVLDDLRAAIAKRQVGAGGRAGVVLSANAAQPAAGVPLSGAQSARAAAVELLSHTYFHNTKGQEAVWIVSVPTSFTEWPATALNGKTVVQATALLNAAAAERFSADDRKHIQTAAQTGLAWTLKALTALDDVKDGSTTLAKLRTWFGNDATTNDDLRNFAATLKTGLKKIAGKLNGGTAIVTDFVPLRGAAEANDLKARQSNAFVIGGADALDVIYIEDGFFGPNNRNVFQSNAKHWARIMVHEMTHREMATVDKRYGWAGIGCAAGKITPADARVNADSWAIFVADAAGVMDAGEVTRATNGA